jgi:hypothetical protein
MRLSVFSWLAFGALCLGACAAPAAPPATEADWRANWAVAPGFALERDTTGYTLPTSLAFVPQPGPGPKDPLYFVAELGGVIKVVSNDRSVSVFAQDFFQSLALQNVPENYQPPQIGLTGLCLDPAHGYVFADYAYQVSESDSYDGMVRFDTRPGVFGLQPEAVRTLPLRFSVMNHGFSQHIIGNCVVAGEAVYVGVGEGYDPAQSQNPDSTLGKILRLSLDGQPLPDNPFASDASPDQPRNYVYALGLRNPFGLALTGGVLFAADNGNAVDRFVRVTRGANYLWDGTDLSIGSAAVAVIAPSVAPGQLAAYPAGSTLFPDAYRAGFFLAGTAFENGKRSGVLWLDYDSAAGRLKTPPRYVARYLNSDQRVVSVAFGPDGLYFSDLFALPGGAATVYRLRYDPAHAHPYLLSDQRSAPTLLLDYGCYDCHLLSGRGGTGGPSLQQPGFSQRLRARLNSPEYRPAVAALDLLSGQPFPAYRAARQQVLAAAGDEQLRLWVKFHLLEPRFDDASAQMPNLGLSEKEAALIADYLLQLPPAAAAAPAWNQYVPKLISDHWFLSGAAAGALAAGLAALGLARLRARRKPPR